MQNSYIDGERRLSESPLRHDTQHPPRELSQPGNSETQKQRPGLLAWTKRNFVRELWDWARCKQVSHTSIIQLRHTLAALDKSLGCCNYEDTESPIFLLASGWRSGSTLLQRILVTDPHLLLWGEPLGEMTLVSEIAGSLSRLSTFPALAESCVGKDEVFASLPTSWIATLYPPGNDFRLGLRHLFDYWLGQPARRRGFKRWGFKEVRLGAAEAILLHWLYPKAKFVFLSRNPYDCYRSLADSGWHHVYHSRPNFRVDSAAGLARHWNRIALSWSELPADFPALHVKYEDMVGGSFNFRRLESWLGIEIHEEVALSAVVSRTARRHRLGWCEHLIISQEAAAGMQTLQY